MQILRLLQPVLLGAVSLFILQIKAQSAQVEGAGESVEVYHIIRDPGVGNAKPLIRAARTADNIHVRSTPIFVFDPFVLVPIVVHYDPALLHANAGIVLARVKRSTGNIYCRHCLTPKSPK